ncbi:MAG: hypothetical protein D6820_02320, partial [Lentisphaerae bacterium]
MTKIRNNWWEKFPIIVAAAMLFLARTVAEDGTKRFSRLEDLFPAEYKNWKVRRKTLSEEERQRLRRLGFSAEVIELYGDVFVKGYAADHLRWGDLPLDRDPQISLKYDLTGLRKLPPLPKMGHPRMFFTDAEREQHRYRLEHTKAGKVAMKILNCYVACLKGTLDPKADYLKPDILKGSFGTHGFLPLFRFGDRSGKAYRNYSHGIAEGKLNLGGLAIEAYRCWVWDDKEAATLAAKALETYVRELLTRTPKDKRPPADFQIAFCYDFLYNAMTPAQRELVHSLITLCHYDNNQYGCFQDAIATTSNWTSFSYRIFSWLPLDGDPGFNQLMYRGYVRGMRNFLTYGWFPNGTCWEGMGKNQLGGEIIYVMTRRGENLAGHPHLLANLREYMPHAIVPWGGAYIAYDLLGGLRLLNINDILPLKYLYPNDRRIDWVYRNTVFEDYSFPYRNVYCEFSGDRIRVNYWGNPALITIMFLTDYLPDNSDPARLGLKESFFDPLRGLVITRSDWTKEASLLHHHCRGASGGHVFADRNNFIFAGKGRMWIVNDGSHTNNSASNNIVTVDDWKQDPSAPGKMVDYKRTPLATFSCGDATPAWQWRYQGIGNGKYTLEDAKAGRIPIPEGWEKVMLTFNDFTYSPSPADSRPDLNQPLFYRPHWLLPGRATALIRQRTSFPIKNAFRTAGLVRGQYPYALILDDIGVTDNQNHRFTWNAKLPTDTVLLQQRKLYFDAKGNPIKTRRGNPPPNAKRSIVLLTLMGAS